MPSLEERVGSIEKRNRIVEADKAWETSLTRKATIAVLTYGVVVFYLDLIEAKEPWLNAIVPVVGFYLSTLALGVIKKAWIRRFR